MIKLTRTNGKFYLNENEVDANVFVDILMHEMCMDEDEDEMDIVECECECECECEEDYIPCDDDCCGCCLECPYVEEDEEEDEEIDFSEDCEICATIALMLDVLDDDEVSGSEAFTKMHNLLEDLLDLN